MDITERRFRQEKRELQAKIEREKKELEGCTFAPTFVSKKRRAVPAETASISLPLHIDEDGLNSEEIQREREHCKFLDDQKNFEDKKRQK